MVCLGNICRSPLAEGILKSKNFDGKIEIDSAGTAGYHIGEKPDKRSIVIAEQYDIDISGQKSRKFNIEDFDEFDYIYVMDNSNYDNVIALARNENDKAKVKLILNEVSPGENLEVPDPYYGEGDSGFALVLDLIEDASHGLLNEIQNVS